MPEARGTRDGIINVNNANQSQHRRLDNADQVHSLASASMVWAQQTTTTTTTTTSVTTVSDDDSSNPSGASVGNPLRLGNENAKRAYKALYERSEPLGKVLISGKPAGKPAPDTCMEKAPELNYDKPNSFVVVSKSLIPSQMTEENIKTSAIRELPDDASKEEIDDMIELIKAIRTVFQETCKSKHDLLLTAAIREEGFPFNKHGRICANNKEVYSAFQSQPPSLSFLEKMYKVFYDGLESNGYREKLTYETMRELKLWHSNDSTSGLNKTKSCFHSLTVDIVRNSRGKYSKTKARVNHGVSVTISAVGGRKHRRDPKKGFIPQEYVKGWAEPKHELFNARHGFPKPLPLADAIAEFEAARGNTSSYGPSTADQKVCAVCS